MASTNLSPVTQVTTAAAIPAVVVTALGQFTSIRKAPKKRVVFSGKSVFNLAFLSAGGGGGGGGGSQPQIPTTGQIWPLGLYLGSG